MRTISLFPFLVILFLCFPVYADDITESGQRKNKVFTLTTNFGVLLGQAEEIVYPGSLSQNNSEYLSMLNWDYKPLFYLGFDAEYGPRLDDNGLHLSFGLRYGLPFKTGIMEDRDWLSVYNNYLTHYSRHDAYAGYTTFLADFFLGYSWVFDRSFWLEPYGELSYLRFSWKSWDGYMQYAPYDSSSGDYTSAWNSNLPKIYYSGPVIDYTQNWIILAPGVSAGFWINDTFSLSAFAAITPLIIGLNNDDHLHPGKIVTYLDVLLGGIYVRAGAELQFILNEKIGFSLSASVMSLSMARGDSYLTRNGRPYERYAQTAGGGFFFTDCSLSVKYTF